MTLLTRRAALVGAGALALPGCERLNADPTFTRVLQSAERFNLASQRLLLSSTGPLAREYAASERSPIFKANGSTSVGGETYARWVETGFADWRLRIDGLVQRPLSLSLDQLKALPQRSQITRHDCVEGWSAIGGWTGPQLGGLLRAAGLLPQARYVVFHCADRLGGAPYYESIDLVDAFHPQTILAHAMNGEALPVQHGAPLRVRIERQLGYKMAKYVMRIEAVANLAPFGRGKGGYWEDRGYEWYAGI